MKKQIKEIYYKCPECKATTTKSDMMRDIECYGMGGYCMCSYNKGRILTGYINITKKEYEKLNRKKKNGKKTKKNI